MTLVLPDPKTERLSRSPLSLVVCQVRHEQQLAATDTKAALAVHEVIRDAYPVIEEQMSQDLTIAAGPMGVQAAPASQARGWRMRSSDGLWTAVLMPTFYALETTKYATWTDFRERLVRLTGAISETVSPALEQRIGVRMIDRIARDDVDGPQGWEPWINQHLLGPILHPNLGAGITASQQVLNLKADAGRTIVLHHGCSRDVEAGAWVYILDHDCFSQRGVAFDADQAIAESDALHDLACRVFQEAITPALYESFDPES